MGRKLNTTVEIGGVVYAAGTDESEIEGKITAEGVWDGEGSSTGYDGRKADDLQAEADKRGLEVEGTGKDGNVLKSDLVDALQADDEG